jgi:hypothetical protein
MQQVLDQQIVSYLPILGDEEKKSLIRVIKSFLNLKKQTSGSISIEEYNQELAEAEEEYKKGETISHEEMKKLVKQW